MVAVSLKKKHGTVKRLGASLSQLSRTLPVEAEVPNNDGRLRPGLFARARIVVPGATTPAVLVPEAAVGTTGSSSRVFVKNGSKVVEKLVKTGRRDGALVEVSGIAETGEVVVTNVDKLVDAADVIVNLVSPIPIPALPGDPRPPRSPKARAPSCNG